MYHCDFGERLRELRQGRNLTQQEFGLKVGLSKAVVSKYENSMSYPTFDILVRIAHYFGVTTDFLLGTASSKTLDVSGLTDGQITAIQQLISEFTKVNRFEKHT